jgi:hypothetical protein
MSVTSKKNGKTIKAKPRRATVKKATANQTKGLQLVQRELTEAREQQAATGDILRMIARAGRSSVGDGYDCGERCSVV